MSSAIITGLGLTSNWCGVSESVYQLTQNFRTQVPVIGCGELGLIDRLKEEAWPTRVCNYSGPELRSVRRGTLRGKASFGVSFIGYGLRLLKLIRSMHIDSVYVGDGLATVVAVPWLRLAQVRILLGVRGKPGRATGWMPALQGADLVLPLSADLADDLRRVWGTNRLEDLEKKLHVLYNGVDLSEFGPEIPYPTDIQVAAQLPENRTLILVVARFDPQKGQEEFVEGVLPRLRDFDGPRPVVVFCGEPRRKEDQSYFLRCRRAVARVGWSESVRFLGFQENIAPWYRVADLVVLPSFSEGMPRTLIEALASATPAVSYQVSSAQELLGESGGGVVVPLGDSQAMSEAIMGLLGNPMRRREMGDRGRRFAERCLDIRVIAAELESLLESLY